VDQIKKIPFCDLHCDTAMELFNGALLSATSTEVNIPFMKEGNVALQLFACYLPPSIHRHLRVSVVSEVLEKLTEEIANNSNVIALCKDYKTVQQAFHEQKLGAILTIENGMAIENSLKNLEMFFSRGIRCLTIVHAESHEWAISSNDKKPQFDGLTDFGERAIRAMNEMGMIIDLSHAHDCTVKKVLKISRKPVLATHSCVHALCPVPRNLQDALIKGIADTGGMIGINFFPGFLDATYADTVTKRAGELFAELSKAERASGGDLHKISSLFGDLRLKIKQMMADTRVSVDRIIDHIDYIINLVGDDFVGFGSDFDGIPDSPAGLDSCRDFNLIRKKLIDRGYSIERIEKIAYKNFLRVFQSHQN